MSRCKEGGIRVPFLMRWNGHLGEGRVEARPIIQLDVVPTALAAVGVTPQPAWKLDGVDLLPFLTGKKSEPPHQALSWRLGDMMAIRKGDWKLVKTSDQPPGTVDATAASDLSGVALYDLAHDIGEANDLAAAHPEKVRELREDWQRSNTSLAKPLWPPGGGGQ